MPNRNYLAGRRFEYARKRQWEKDGFVVLRTAGSHGFADLIAIDKQDHIRPCFIQCKVVATQSQRARLLSKFEKSTTPSKLYNQLLEVKVKGSTDIQYAHV